MEDRNLHQWAGCGGLDRMRSRGRDWIESMKSGGV